MVRVTSIVTHSVTCGAVNAEATIAWAVILRTPLTGTRVSRCPGAGAYDGAPAAAVSGPPPAADSTSARVTTPPSPDGVSVVRSTPRSLASLRTGGLASTRAVAPSPSPAMVCAGADSGASSTVGSCTGVGVVIIEVCTACCAVAADGPER